MKKIATWLIAIPLLSCLIFISSCKKDDSGPVLPDIQNITFTQTGNLTVISWKAVQEAQSYMVSVDGIAASAYPIVNTNFGITSLADGAEIKIDAFMDPLLSKIIASTTTIFEKQSSASVNNIEFIEMGGNVVVTWDPVADAKSYMVSIAGIPVSEYPITSTSYNAGSLMNGVAVEVEAFSDSQATQLIATGTSIYNSQGVGSITNLELIDYDYGVSVSWDSFYGADYYMILKNGQPAISSPITYTQYQLGTLLNGTIITVEAYADGTLQNLVAIGEIVYSSTELRPNPVTSLAQDNIGSNFVSLSWINPSGEFTAIEIYNGQRVEGNTSNMVKKLTSGEISTTIYDLIDDYTYNFYVYAVNENNSSEMMKYSEGSSITVTTEMEETNLNGTEWYKPDGVGYADEMTLTFHENTVDWQDGDDYFYEGLSYSYDPITRTGVIDEGGYYDGDFSIDQNGIYLTLMGDLVFMRIQK